MPDPPSFVTTDLGAASFLVAKGWRLQEIGGRPGGRRTFAFAAEARTVAATYLQGAEVPARAFASALRDLKTILREGG